MAATTNFAPAIPKPPRLFSAEAVVAEDALNLEQQVSERLTPSFSVTAAACAEVTNLTPGINDVVEQAEQPPPTRIEANAVAESAAATAADDDELELWKLSHRNAMQRLMDLTDRYSELEIKQTELQEKYNHLLRHINSSNSSRIPASGLNGEQQATEEAESLFGFHDLTTDFSTTVDEYGFIVPRRLRAEPQNILPENIRTDLANERTKHNSVFYSTKTESINLVVFEKEESNRRISSFSLNDHISISASAHRVKFEKLLASRRSMPPEQFHSQLKHLMRYGAPTRELRTVAWKYCINYHLNRRRCSEYVLSNSKQYYQSLLGAEIDENLSRSNTLQMSAAKQISLDLLRTFPNNIHFKENSSTVIKRLENVLTAFSRHNYQIGYTQGMNRLAGIALLCLPDEADAFWTLVTIAEHLLGGYYGDTMCELLIDQRVLAELVQEKIPRLAAHLKSHHIDINLFSFNWFLVVFVDSTFPCVFMPLWDAFMLEGKKVLFRYALAMLRYGERELIALDSCSELNNFLRSMGERIDTAAGAAKLRRIAFGDMNPLSARMIERKRRQHRVGVEAELASIQQARDEIRWSSKAAVEAGADTLNVVNENRIVRELLEQREEDLRSSAEPDGRRLCTDLDSSVSSLYFPAATTDDEEVEEEGDDDSWHSVQSSYNYEKFDDDASRIKSPYARRVRGDEKSVELTADFMQTRKDKVRTLSTSSLNVRAPAPESDARSAMRRSVSAGQFFPAPPFAAETDEKTDARRESARLFEEHIGTGSFREADRNLPPFTQSQPEKLDHEYFSVRCMSQTSTRSESASTATGQTPVPPPRKSQQRQRQLSASSTPPPPPPSLPSHTRFGRLISRASALRSSFGGTATTKKAMLNRAISNAASRQGEYLRRKFNPSKQVACAGGRRTEKDDDVREDAKCEHCDKPLLLSHNVEESGLSTFYYKFVRKCQCAMDDAERSKILDVISDDIMPASLTQFNFPTPLVSPPEEAAARTSEFFYSESGSDMPTEAEAEAVGPQTRTSRLAVTLRSAVAQSRLGQLVNPDTITIHTEHEETTVQYVSTPESTAALIAVQEAVEKQKNSNDVAVEQKQKMSDSSRFVIKFPREESFRYATDNILSSGKPIDF